MKPYAITPLLTDAQIDLITNKPGDAIQKLELAIHMIRTQLLDDMEEEGVVVG